MHPQSNLAAKVERDTDFPLIRQQVMMWGQNYINPQRRVTECSTWLFTQSEGVSSGKVSRFYELNGIEYQWIHYRIPISVRPGIELLA
jgi:hypothetical protein